MSYKEIEFQEYDLRIQEVERGLIVSQEGKTYLARRWQLTPEVIEVIETAIAAGLNNLWQEGHPSKDESHHISFSFSRDPVSWVFVIGGEARPPKLRFVTFQNRLAPYFKQFKEDGLAWAWDWENAGGHNILTKPEDLKHILAALPLDDIRNGNLVPRGAGFCTLGNGRYVGSEAELEFLIFQSLKKDSRFKEIRRQWAFSANRKGERSIRTDLIATTGGEVVIAEIKLGFAGEADMSQIIRYTQNVSLQSTFSEKKVVGVLIASGVSEDALSLARLNGISYYEYRQLSGLELILRVGENVLFTNSVDVRAT